MLRQILANFGNNFAPYVGVTCLAQIRQGTRWGNDENGLDLFRPNQLFHGARYPASEVMLLYLVPIGRRYTAAPIC